MSTLTRLIQGARDGGRGAQDALFEGAYPELRKLAHSRLYAAGRNESLETTALVHEAYLRFLQAGQLQADNRLAFFAYASRIMRSVIVDEVRARHAERRGGGLEEVTLDTAVSNSLPAGERDIVRVHDALLALEGVEERLARVVEMRYFGGYTEAEIAEMLGVTERTVRRDWEKARLLMIELLRH